MNHSERCKVEEGDDDLIEVINFKLGGLLKPFISRNQTPFGPSSSRTGSRFWSFFCRVPLGPSFYQNCFKDKCIT